MSPRLGSSRLLRSVQTGDGAKINLAEASGCPNPRPSPTNAPVPGAVILPSRFTRFFSIHYWRCDLLVDPDNSGGSLAEAYGAKCGHEWFHLTPKPERMGSRNLWQFQSLVYRRSGICIGNAAFSAIQVGAETNLSQRLTFGMSPSGLANAKTLREKTETKKALTLIALVAAPLALGNRQPPPSRSCGTT